MFDDLWIIVGPMVHSQMEVWPTSLYIFFQHLVLKKWLGVNEKLTPKTGPSRPMWVKLSPSNLCIY